MIVSPLPARGLPGRCIRNVPTLKLRRAQSGIGLSHLVVGFTRQMLSEETRMFVLGYKFQELLDASDLRGWRIAMPF